MSTPVKYKYSYLITKLVEYDDYKKYSYYIVPIGAVLYAALIIASNLCYSKFVATCMHYSMGLSLIFIIYWLEVIIFLDFGVADVDIFSESMLKHLYSRKSEFFDGCMSRWELLNNHNWWPSEFYDVRIKTMIWNIIVAVIGVVLLVVGLLYASCYEFACGEYILDPMTKEYHLWDECERINEDCIEVKGYQIKDRKIYHICPDCYEGLF